MKIETELNIGDTMYCVVWENVDTKCAFCDGHGRVDARGANGETKRMNCPVCYGNGVTKTKSVYLVKDRKVDMITARVSENGTAVYYTDLSGLSFISGIDSEMVGWCVRKDRAFRTKEAAQKYADMLNREEKA